MKRFLLLACLSIGLFTVQLSAQSCCSKKTAATTASCAQKATTATAAADLDANIEARTDQATGAVSYVRKSVCETSGRVSYSAVNYDAESGTFVEAEAVAATDRASLPLTKQEKKQAKKAAKKKNATEAAACDKSAAKEGASCCDKKSASKA